MKGKISKSFEIFAKEAPEHQKAFCEFIQNLEQANTLDPKTSALVYLAVLSSLGLKSGIPFHVEKAKEANATKEEIISAILIGLPAAGNVVIKSLEKALKTYSDKE